MASWIGYLLIGPLLFLLLRVRFSELASFVVAAACILLPPVIEHSTLRGVDSWGLALTIASLLFLALAVTRGLRWLPAFVVAIALLSITRDNTLGSARGGLLARVGGAARSPGAGPLRAPGRSGTARRDSRADPGRGAASRAARLGPEQLRDS